MANGRIENPMPSSYPDKMPTSVVGLETNFRPRQPSGENVVEIVDCLLAEAVTRRASDAHFEPTGHGIVVRYRLDGLLCDVDRLPESLADNVIARLKVMAGLLTYRKDIPQEGAFRADERWNSAGPLDVRVATFPTIRGERAAVRFIYNVGQVSGLEELGFSEAFVTRLRKVADRPQGLILVTGPAGSGKSTTLCSVARYILASHVGRSVVSLEDPVEQRVTGLTQIQVQPHGELSYVCAMRSLLRQDVEVLLVGEIRDAQTAHIVIEAALTGHLILSTLHSGDPSEAIVRLLEMGVAPYQLAGALTAVISQRLVRTLCADCRGAGRCVHCMDTGYRGRTGCGQIVVLDEPLRRAVLEQRPAGELRRLVGQGGADLAADGQRLVREGRTDRPEVLRVLGHLAESGGTETGKDGAANARPTRG